MKDLCVFLLLLTSGVAAQQGTCGKTPMDLEERFLSSCETIVRDATRCNRAWSAFRGAFAGMPPETVVESNYAPYFDEFPIRVVANQSLFWTRTSALVDILSMMNAMGVNIVSSKSEHIISSAIINRITPNDDTINWCGNDQGIDYESNCLCSVTGNFWARFSNEFAMVARGAIFYLTNGEDPMGSFRANSFFAREELPFLTSNVTSLIALVVHREGVGESCSDTNSSIQTLRSMIVERGFSFDCYDIFGQANSTSQTEAISTCIRSVVDKVQDGNPGTGKQIQCAGSTTAQVSMVLMLFSLLLNTLFQ